MFYYNQVDVSEGINIKKLMIPTNVDKKKRNVEFIRICY